ncbi:hypothetical protein ACEPAF_6420 [Sanghuangporus sanghuang]
MASESNWQDFLDGHPIFLGTNSSVKNLAELPLSSVKERKTDGDGDPDATSTSRRRQVMCMKDSDLIVACGSEIRMTCLADAKVSGGSKKTYKVLHTPNIDFEIRQICLNPNKKLLAAVGASRVAVVVLPRTGSMKLGSSRIDCKSLQIGSNYHSKSSSPIVKADWHPWGEAGSTLLVMTVDGKMREYDVSFDPDEPQKTLDFVSEKKKGSYAAIDDSEREVVSFAFGKGRADWGPLTVYALMKSGDIYAFCPYLPENASVPSSYLHALECFVAAKEEFAAEGKKGVSKSFSTLYDYQRKYVNGLLKQVPPVPSSPSVSRSVFIRTPKSFPGHPSRQGPFFLQPSPPELKESPGADATDIIYITLGSAFAGTDDQEDATSLSSERLGVILVAFQDGKVDVYLDLEKVEAKWDTTIITASLNSRPAITTYETIDLGLLSQLVSASKVPDTVLLDLIESNHVTFYPDPIYDDTIYAYHAFGAHALNFSATFQILASAMKEEDEKVLQDNIKQSTNNSVQTLLSTYSTDRHKRSTCPVIAAVIPKDVYLTYTIFMLTATMRVATHTLTLRSESADGLELVESSQDTSGLPALPSSSGPPAYVSLLTAEPFSVPPVLSRPVGLPTVSNVPVPRSHSIKDEIRVTPETLRYLANVQERISSEMHEAIIACRQLKGRGDMQRQEYERLQKRVAELVGRTQTLLGPRKNKLQERLQSVQAEQTRLLGRMDRLLHALIRQASPELNEHETRWFEELQRMKAQVLGIGRYDPDSLRVRIKQLQTEFERLMPALKQLAKEQAERKAQLEEHNIGAGHSYMKSYERLSRTESKKIEDAMVQVTKLARKLEIASLRSHRCSLLTQTMSEPLKGGFSSFTSGTSFKPPGAASTPPPSTTPFSTAQNTGTNAQATNTPSAFGTGASGGTSLFGAKPATSSIFGGGTTSTTGAGGSNLFSGFGSNASTNPTAQSASPSPAAASTSTPVGGLFAAKPPEQTANTNPSGTPSAPQPGASLFGGTAGNTSASQPAPTATTSGTPNLFGKPAETTSTTAPAAGVQTGSSLFGNAAFGKKPDTPTAQGTTPASSNPTPASLFAGFGAKKNDGADKDKQQTAPTAGVGAFGQASSNKDTPAATGSTFNLFGKPAEKKDAPTEGEKKDGAAGASSGVNTSGTSTIFRLLVFLDSRRHRSEDKPAGTGTPTPISVPPPSMLRGKTIEEIVNKWSSELETHVREFNGLAGEIAVWDRALIDNGNTIAALLQHIMMAEREQSDIEQSLKHVEDQQKELASTLEVYEKAAGDIFDAQGGGLRALDVGPADAERDKHYTLAAELNANLDDLSRSLLQMIESVNSLSESENIGSDVSRSKGDAPLEQIAQILSSHLESLQWIDSAVKEVESKVTDVERLVRDASVNGSRTGGGGSGSFKESVNGLRGSRGFGLR